MKTIKEIKTIEIKLLDGGCFKAIFNGIEGDSELNVPFENYRHAARALTRLAMEMWAMMDTKLNEEEDEK